MKEVIPVDTFYKGRSEFSIIGLTGVAGSGCSSFANLLGDKDFLFRCVRRPESLSVSFPDERNSVRQRKLKDLDVNSSINGFVNKKKYEICYNYVQENYEAYDVIKYTKLLWLYLLLYIKHTSGDINGDILSSWIVSVLKDKFKLSRTHDTDLKEKLGYTQEKRFQEIQGIVDGFSEWQELSVALQSLNTDWVGKRFASSEPREEKKKLAQFFLENPSFLHFVSYFTKAIADTDYYSSCFFYHRLATQVRASGDPFKPYDSWFDTDDKGCDYLYTIVSIIVLILSGRIELNYHNRVVIDSIRNSAEALYLRERYSGFYLIAIHDENSIDHLKNKVKSLYAHHKYENQIVNLFFKSILRLNRNESEQDDFERGIFSSPDTNRVIECSEIHIQNIWGDPDTSQEESLKYMAEKWIHYAALILHPGLVTPTAAERCMAVAYTAKLNSGCLSRQVGAAITNKDGSVRSIGWNEVPHGQVSCSLRTIDGVESEEACEVCSYSEFEMMGTVKYRDNKSFIDKIKDDYGQDLSPIKARLHGLPFSYCFRALHNRYEGEKNQIFTRSLHAEENAIIQMSKYGGEALKDGIIYVTASPCELCSKKLYQIGVRQIVYVDPYPGIARQHIIAAGFKQPDLKVFEGAIGPTYFKLYQPFMPYKDEIEILIEGKHRLNSPKTLLESILKEIGESPKQTYTDSDMESIMLKIRERTGDVS